MENAALQTHNQFLHTSISILNVMIGPEIVEYLTDFKLMERRKAIHARPEAHFAFVFPL